MDLPWRGLAGRVVRSVLTPHKACIRHRLGYSRIPRVWYSLKIPSKGQGKGRFLQAQGSVPSVVARFAPGRALCTTSSELKARIKSMTSNSPEKMIRMEFLGYTFNDQDPDRTGVITREDAVAASMVVALGIRNTHIKHAAELAVKAVAEMSAHPTHITKEEFLFWWFFHLTRIGQFYNPFNQIPPTNARRFQAWIIDLWAYMITPAFLSGVIPVPVSTIDEILTWLSLPIVGVLQEADLPHSEIYLPVLCYVLKDVFTSRSIGKWIMSIEIVQLERVYDAGRRIEHFRTTNVPATRIMNLFRGVYSISYLFLPSPDPLLILTGSKRGLAEYFTNTMCVDVSKLLLCLHNSPQKEVNCDGNGVTKNGCQCIIREGPMYENRVNRLKEDPRMQNWSVRSSLCVVQQGGPSGEGAGAETEALRPRISKFPPTHLVILGTLITYVLFEFIDDDEDDDTYVDDMDDQDRTI